MFGFAQEPFDDSVSLEPEAQAAMLRQMAGKYPYSLAGVEGDAVRSVSDDGPGIPERLLPVVFERFAPATARDH